MEQLTQLLSYIKIDMHFFLSAFMIFICPITWNLVARMEFHTKFFSKLVGDNRLAADIFAHILIEMGIFRNYIFTRLIQNQPALEVGKYEPVFYWLSVVCMLLGGFLVFMALYRLGIHGIYYADYFGILFSEKVTAFPYNVTDNPLYQGSTLLFLMGAFYYKSVTGFLLTGLAYFMYHIAALMENPMTDLIYSEKNIEECRKLNEDRKRKENEDNRLKND
jgi:phosphatidylethanolamine N-methyltransferase